MTALCPINVNVMLVAFFFCCSASIKFGYTALKAALVFMVFMFSVCPHSVQLSEIYKFIHLFS